jgi:hypothetical protein
MFNVSLLSGQSTFKATLLDSDNNKPLEYVNIGIVGKNVGTVSGKNGNFEIQLPPQLDTCALRISMIGFKTINYSVAEFRTVIQKMPTIKMEPESALIDEVVINESKLKAKILGNKTTSKNVTAGFSSNILGNEVGYKVKLKKKETYIKDLNLNIVTNEYDTLIFRVNIYDTKGKLPNNRITSQNIIVTTDIKEGPLKIDLLDYNIVVKDDFFITLEWIKDLGESGLFFSASLMGRGIVFRSTSQANWERKGIATMGFNVTVLQ